MENVRVLNDNIVHVDRVELGEVPRKRDQVNGRLLVELEEVRVASIVPLPS